MFEIVKNYFLTTPNSSSLWTALAAISTLIAAISATVSWVLIRIQLKQTKKLFKVLNEPYVAITRYKSFTIEKENKFRILLRFCNGGNIPAYNFKSVINILSPKILKVETPTKYPLVLFPRSSTDNYFDTDLDLLNKSSPDTPIHFSVDYTFDDFENNTYIVNSIHDYYPHLGEIINLGQNIKRTKKSHKV